MAITTKCVRGQAKSIDDEMAFSAMNECPFSVVLGWGQEKGIQMFFFPSTTYHPQKTAIRLTATEQ